MSDNDHKIISEIKARVGGTMADQVTDEMITSEMLYLAPSDRADVLMRVDAWLGDEDADLRKRAQLVNIRRNMREIDFEMRKAGR